MSSKNVRLGRDIAPPSSPESDASSEQFLVNSRRKKRKRDANVYDAVAGRVTTTHALDDASTFEIPYQRHQRASLRDSTLAPEDVLFRRAEAPTRYAEKDIYHAHERLPNGGRDMLPDSDMLKSIHSYSSHFYAALAMAHGPDANSGRVQKNMDEQSMDETALLAFGILLEEAGRDILGKKGDLVFTEGVEEDGAGNQHGRLGSEAVGFLDERSPAPGSRRKSRPTAATKVETLR